MIETDVYMYICIYLNMYDCLYIMSFSKNICKADVYWWLHANTCKHLFYICMYVHTFYIMNGETFEEK